MAHHNEGLPAPEDVNRTLIEMAHSVKVSNERVVRTLDQLKSKVPEVAKYSTVSLNADRVTPVLGVDLSRKRVILSASSTMIYIGDRGGLEWAGSTSGAAPGFLVPQTGNCLILENSAELFALNTGADEAFLYLIVESFAQ